MCKSKCSFGLPLPLLAVCVFLLFFCTNSSIFNIAVIPHHDSFRPLAQFLLVMPTTIFRIYNVGPYICKEHKIMTG